MPLLKIEPETKLPQTITKKPNSTKIQADGVKSFKNAPATALPVVQKAATSQIAIIPI
jgi:hypothetical protein